jgi:universal stress protein E
MLTIRRILVAIKDPRTRKLPALAKAAQLARACGAELELFHAIADPIATDPYESLNQDRFLQQRVIRTRYMDALGAIAAPLRRSGLTVNVSAEWDFPVYESMVRRAQQVKADLIVAECHAGKRLAPWLLHVTDWELLRTSPVPVLLVKSPRAWRRPVVLAAVDPGHRYAKPAKLDAKILDAASTVTQALRGSMHAMHAYMPVPLNALSWGTTSAQVMQQMVDAAEQNARDMFARALKSSKLPARRRHLTQGLPAQAIPRIARKVGSDIVVMGAISRSGLKRALIGNTAETVLAELPCDVLVVKPAGFDAPVSRATRGARYVTLPRTPIPY